MIATDLITKVYFNEHLTHSCVGMPQGLQALLSSFIIKDIISILDQFMCEIICYTSTHSMKYCKVMVNANMDKCGHLFWFSFRVGEYFLYFCDF